MTTDTIIRSVDVQICFRTGNYSSFSTLPFGVPKLLNYHTISYVEYVQSYVAI